MHQALATLLHPVRPVPRMRLPHSDLPGKLPSEPLHESVYSTCVLCPAPSVNALMLEVVPTFPVYSWGVHLGG